MSRAAKLALLVVAALILHLVLVQPNHPSAMTPGALLLFPLELPVILLGLMLLPTTGRLTVLVRFALVGLLVVTALLKVADYAMFTAFARSFNPIIDMPLVDAGWNLLTGSVGAVSTAVVVAAGSAALILTVIGLWWATGRWAAVSVPPRWRRATRAAALVATGIAVADMGHASSVWRLPFDPPGAAFTASVGVQRTMLAARTVADISDFSRAAAEDELADRDDLFDSIGNRDVILIYVESYGRTSFDNPLYATTHRATLRNAERMLASSGLSTRSGWLTSPIAGGQSWLAHGTLASGLLTDNQARYGAMLMSPRRTLFHLAQEAGFETLAVMPAITLAWPEGERMGFGRIYDAEALAYRGKPFNWVTMPDQFTLSALERILSQDRTGRGRMVQVALISSHAPWLPIPELIDWDEVGDGSAFDRWATSGETPETVWRDQDRVRNQYRLAVDYALRAVTEFAARQAPRTPLIVVLGDHQPARFVSQIESRDVPVHIIAPQDLMSSIDGWGWAEGMVPDASTPVWPMAAFRDTFIEAFSVPPAGPVDTSLVRRPERKVDGSRLEIPQDRLD
ncbi:sulfatase-like hydrolase/transferase [Mesorhizobium sp. CAU 1732]|uniref:sulfatase-like hydrolase/transferase n=1 Tax=Mesorhizobium sp. CAU 1732 TaxID=3140358 RepID=UPI0032603774